jgi:hypothetical protein
MRVVDSADVQTFPSRIGGTCRLCEGRWLPVSFIDFDLFVTNEIDSLADDWRLEMLNVAYVVYSGV